MRIILVCIFSLFGVGCSTQQPVDFKGDGPRLNPEEFFVGTLSADGVFFDRWNRVRRRFHLDLTGEMKGDELHLLEHLTYSDGESLQRTYVFTKIDDHHYEAHADGLVGPAKIESYGNVLRWKYSLRQQIGKREWVLTFDDWMYRVADDLVLNRAYASKYGIRIGEVFMLVRKID